MEYPARSLTGMMAVFINDRTLTATVQMRREKQIVWAPGDDYRCPPLAMTRTVRRDERGSRLILFTLMITVMLVFVALAMDSGLVFNERRQDQSAVGRGRARRGTAPARRWEPTPPPQGRAEEEIIDRTLTNTQVDQWRHAPVPRMANGSGWTACSRRRSRRVRAWPTESPCIAFRDISPGNATTKVWAHLPPITVGSTFGGVVGINSYKSTAEATAEIFIGDPYAVFAGATDCDHKNNVEEVVDIGTNDLRPIDITGPVHSNGMVQLPRTRPNVTVSGFVTYVTKPKAVPQISRPANRSRGKTTRSVTSASMTTSSSQE